MAKYIVLAQTTAEARPLVEFRNDQLSGDSPFKANSSTFPEPIIVLDAPHASESGTILYGNIVDELQRAIGPRDTYDDRAEVVVIVDSVRVDHLNALSDHASWDNLIALLILTFPDVRWMFANMEGPAEHVSLLSDHNMLALLFGRREPLLDPTGLRSWIISNTASHNVKNINVPRRSRIAAVIEDEIEFGYLHGYTAYRFGYRVEVINSWSLLERCFHDRSNPPKTHNPYQLLLEDMRLQFPDHPPHIRMSKLEDRVSSAHLDLLGKKMAEGAQGRFLITTGQHSVDEDLLKINKAFLRSNEDRFGNRTGVLLKPIGGIFDLWQKLGFLSGKSKRGARPGNVPGFVWPPARPSQVDVRQDGHGAPGKLGLVASSLLARATAALSAASSPVDYLRAAVLAGDASELLAARNPTSTLSALAIRHEAEIRAECAFLGSGFHLNMRSRIKEIQQEVRSVCAWFERRHVAALNAEVCILNRLVLVLRSAGQFEEENECHVALRWANRRVQWRTANLIDKMSIQVLLAYAEWLLGDIRRLLLATSAWVVALWMFAALEQQVNKAKMFHPMSMAIGAFFGGQTPPSDANLAFHIIISIGVISGVFHLGVLISYLYSLISRR